MPGFPLIPVPHIFLDVHNCKRLYDVSGFNKPLGPPTDRTFVTLVKESGKNCTVYTHVCARTYAHECTYVCYMCLYIIEQTTLRVCVRSLRLLICRFKNSNYKSHTPQSLSLSDGGDAASFLLPLFLLLKRSTLNERTIFSRASAVCKSLPPKIRHMHSLN